MLFCLFHSCRGLISVLLYIFGISFVCHVNTRVFLFMVFFWSRLFFFLFFTFENVWVDLTEQGVYLSVKVIRLTCSLHAAVGMDVTAQKVVASLFAIPFLTKRNCLLQPTIYRYLGANTTLNDLRRHYVFIPNQFSAIWNTIIEAFHYIASYVACVRGLPEYYAHPCGTSAHSFIIDSNWLRGVC